MHGERRVEAAPCDEVGAYTGSFSLNLAEACQGVDAGVECRAEEC